MDLDTVYCKLLNNREHSFISLINAKPKHFLCNYKTHCFAVCHCCEFDACDCEMTCPANCTCLHDQTWTTNIVECSASGYTEIPPNIPMDTTELYIDGNNLNELAGHSFLGRKNLEVLYINSSNVQFMYNTTFSGLKRLLILHLEYNVIEELRYNEFDSVENVQEIYLQNNHIYFIANSTFRALTHLHILRIDGNRLLYFEIWQLMHNSYLMQIGLGDNPWSCECSYLMHFRYFLRQCVDKILNMSSISCIYNNATSILSEQNGTKCILHEDTAANTYMHAADIEKLVPILVMASCLFIGFFGLIFALIYYRQYCKDWSLANNCLMNFRQPARLGAAQKAHLNDAYFAYSLQDDQFVSQILASVLERDIGYRLILHYRDVNLHSFLTDAILEAVSNAKVFFIVLSKNFLYNEWSRFDYKSTLHELIVKRRIRLTFILYGDLPQRDIDADMRHYLRTSTCIEWDDKKFWSKLRLAMPHLRNKSKNLPNNRNINIYATSSQHQLQQQLQHGIASTGHQNISNAVVNLNDKRYATINECIVRGEFVSGGVNAKFNTINHQQQKHKSKHYAALPPTLQIISRQTQTLNFEHRKASASNGIATTAPIAPTALTPISTTTTPKVHDYAVPAYLSSISGTVSHEHQPNKHNMATSFSTNFVQKSSFNSQKPVDDDDDDDIDDDDDDDDDDDVNLTDEFNSSNDVTTASNLNLTNLDVTTTTATISNIKQKQHGNLWA